MSRLFISLIAGLVWTGTTCASDLGPGDPQRIALVALARGAHTTGLPTNAALSLRRAWTDGNRALVCAQAVEPSGQALMQRGRLQFKRVHYRKQGRQWQVTRTDRLSLAPHQAVDAVCGPTRADAVLAAAARTLEQAPTAAGQRQEAHRHPGPARAGHAFSGTEGFVSQPGRSLLHSEPDLSRRMGRHIVAGDKVRILARQPGWAQVSYTHPITGVTTEGWVKGHRVSARN